MTHPDILHMEQTGRSPLNRHNPAVFLNANPYINNPPPYACEDCGLEIYEGGRYYTADKTIYCAECFLEAYGGYA